MPRSAMLSPRSHGALGVEANTHCWVRERAMGAGNHDSVYCPDTRLSLTSGRLVAAWHFLLAEMLQTQSSSLHSTTDNSQEESKETKGLKVNYCDTTPIRLLPEEFPSRMQDKNVAVLSVSRLLCIQGSS
jgi:hypothetical protein